MTILNSILQNMKVHQQFPRGFWDLHLNLDNSPPCHRRLRPLAPKLSQNDDVSPLPSPDVKKKVTPQVDKESGICAHRCTYVESQGGGTRWNPTQEQIEILEMLYSRGMRTPNSQEIEQIAVQLSKFGKIEGKNVFYWFQNHKARERQKLKRLSTSPNTTSFLSFDTSTERARVDEGSTSKKKCKSWTFERLIEETSCSLYSRLDDLKMDEDGVKKTLELFPLHPEGK